MTPLTVNANRFGEPMPEWVRWVAIDDDGLVRGFRTKPRFVREHWVPAWGEISVSFGDVFPREAAAALARNEGNGQLYRIRGDDSAHHGGQGLCRSLYWLCVVAVSVCVGYALWLTVRPFLLAMG